MARIPVAIAVMLLASAGVFAQTTTPPPEGEGEYTPIPPPGPIVGGKHLQPSQSDIMERQALRQPGQPAQPETVPQPGSAGSDKELDELYEEVLKQSRPR